MTPANTPGAEATELTAVLKAMESLTGQRVPFREEVVKNEPRRVFVGRDGLGYSQFNELLLLCGYDRVTHGFFQYLVNAEPKYVSGSAIPSVAALWEGVDRFRKLALLLFGNVKYAFKTLSSDTSKLKEWLNVTREIDSQLFAERHAALIPLEGIAPEDTYYLGYTVKKAIKKRLDACPDDEEAKAENEKRNRLVATGKRNYRAYLASDHLDVYVATSMRERHEYVQVSELTQEIFSSPCLRDLNLRWFDPTQAVCEERIDKGLAEALMLRRAKCTVYLAQERDTFGKDSELASTLAQGKPVIAYIPPADRTYIERMLRRLREVNPGVPEKTLALEQLRLVAPQLAWEDREVRRWLEGGGSAEEIIARLSTELESLYEERASMLKEIHPLGIQVGLQSGVANGVLVARTVNECASLIRQILTKTLEFDLESTDVEGNEYLLLREHSTHSIFRVVSGDEMLTNTFWNFYLEEAQ
jgi:hypothetical protein